MNELDIFGLLILSFVVITWAYLLVRTDRVLRDPDHPEYEDARDAISDSETRRTLDYWWQ